MTKKLNLTINYKIKVLPISLMLNRSESRKLKVVFAKMLHKIYNKVFVLKM